MKNRQISTLAILVAVTLVSAALAEERIEILRVPDGGIQPQASIDAEGTLHLLYYKGQGKKGDLFYVTRGAGAEAFSEPIRVGLEANAADSSGSIGLARLAVDGSFRPHVTWFHMNPPAFHYARLRGDGKGFEKERRIVVENGEGVEAGAAVSADGDGNVFLAWHAGELSEEAERGVYGRLSRDGGESFGPERNLTAGGGVCACCGLDALAAGGALYVFYRAAGDGVDRDMTLLENTLEGDAFRSTRAGPWKLNACPVSTTALAAGADSVWMAWETEGQLYLARRDRLDKAVVVPGEKAGRRKNPALAINGKGEVLLVWGDGAGWRSGGKLHWQLFDAAGRPSAVGEADDPIPDFSVATAAVRGDGGFVVVF